MITLYQVIYSQHLHSPTHAPGWTSSINTARPTHPCLREHRAQVQDTTSRKHERSCDMSLIWFRSAQNCRNLPTTRETWSRWSGDARWYVERRRHVNCQIMRRRKERGESQLEIEKLPQGLVGAARWDAETCVSSSSFQASLAFEPESIDATV